jgi:hypothetical protein
MSVLSSRGWRRDMLASGLSSLLTALVLVPCAWASCRNEADQAQSARWEAQVMAWQLERKTEEAAQQRDLAQRALLERAADFAGFGDKAGAEAMRVSTDAVSPEVPKDAWLLIDKKATTWEAGDIVVFRQDGLNFLGRVVAIEKARGRLTIGRNGEATREIAVADLLGRGALNTR